MLGCCIARRVFYLCWRNEQAMNKGRGQRETITRLVGLKLLPRSFRGHRSNRANVLRFIVPIFEKPGISRGKARKSMTRVTPAPRFSVPETQTEV